MNAVGKKTLPIAVNGKFRTTFARRIRIIAHQRLVLTVSPYPLSVLIDLVRRHDEDSVCGTRCADAFEQVDRAHYIRRERVHRLTVTLAHDGLRREMEHDLRPRFVKRAGECGEIPHITAHIAHLLQDAEAFERFSAALRRRVQREARYLRPRTQEQECEPHALKARMPREENAFPAIEIDLHPLTASHRLINPKGP